MNRWSIALLGNLLLAPLAWSQCAPGIPSAGNPGCIPPDQVNSPYYQGDRVQPQENFQPAAVWADRWGAIVVDSDTGQSGFIAGRASKAEAVDMAMKACTMNGSPNCKLELAYHNQCVAVAAGYSSHSAASSAHMDQAKSDAMQLCNERTPQCKVIYSECSYATRVQ
nr:DUF4189 domain-containing protein [Dyella sp. ASV24]